MKYCPDCGTRSEDSALFCGECGFSFANAHMTPQQQAPQQQTYGTPQQDAYGQPVYNTGIPQPVVQEPEKKSKTPLMIAAVVACAALIAVAVGAVAKLGGGTKSGDFVGSQQAFLEEQAETFTESVAKDKFSSDMTISASVNGNDEIVGVLSDVLKDSAIVIKSEASSGHVLYNAALHLRGSNVLEGFAAITNSEIRFSVPNANDNLYVLDMKALYDTLDMPYSDANFNMDPAELRGNLKEMFNRYVGVFSASINKEHIKTEKNDVKLSEVGKTVSCTIMTWTPDEEELVNLCDALADEIENDDKLAELLAPYAQAGDYGDGYDMLREAADSLRDGARDVAEELVDGNFVWTVAVDAKSSVTWISLATDEWEIAMERALDAKGGASAYYATSEGNETFMAVNEYTANGKQRTGTLSIDTPEGSVSVDYDLDLSKRSVYGVPYGTYTPDLRNVVPGLNLTLTVSAGNGGSTDHVLTVGGLRNLTYDMLTDVTVTVNTTDQSTAKEPEGKTVDISGYDEEELEDLFTDLAYDIGSSLMQSPEIMELLESLGGGF